MEVMSRTVTEQSPYKWDHARGSGTRTITATAVQAYSNITALTKIIEKTTQKLIIILQNEY